MRDYRARGEHELAGKVFETVSLRADGTEFPVEMSLNPSRSQGRLFLTSIIRDISERKKMELEVLEREEQFRDLFENANDMIQAVTLMENFYTLTGHGRRPSATLKVNLRT